MKLKSVLIVENEQIKEELLYKRRDVLNEEKIFTIDEFIKNLLFDYTEETIYYIVKNYDVIPSVAKIYLENLYYIDRDYYVNDKL